MNNFNNATYKPKRKISLKGKRNIKIIPYTEDFSQKVSLEEQLKEINVKLAKIANVYFSN